MKSVTLVLAVAVIMAAMMALTVGSALANDTQPEQKSYTDRVEAQQYFARPPSALNPVGISMFRGLATDIEGDRDAGLPGTLDTRIAYTGGGPGPGVTNTITGGTWMLCSHGFKFPPLDTTVNPPTPIPPECTTDSTIALQGTVNSGYAEWNEAGTYAFLPLVGPVYAGRAEVEGDFTVTGGSVYGVPVNGGSGRFEGTIDHTPLLANPPSRPIVGGTLELRF